MELDDKVCYCFHVTKRKVLNYIRIHNPRVPSQISECGGAGTGCGWCVPFLKKYFRMIREEIPESDLISADEYARMRAEYIREGKGVPAPGAEPLPPDERTPGEGIDRG